MDNIKNDEGRFVSRVPLTRTYFPHQVQGGGNINILNSCSNSNHPYTLSETRVENVTPNSKFSAPFSEVSDTGSRYRNISLQKSNYVGPVSNPHSTNPLLHNCYNSPALLNTSPNSNKDLVQRRTNIDTRPLTPDYNRVEINKSPFQYNQNFKSNFSDYYKPSYINSVMSDNIDNYNNSYNNNERNIDSFSSISLSTSPLTPFVPQPGYNTNNSCNNNLYLVPGKPDGVIKSSDNTLIPHRLFNPFMYSSSPNINSVAPPKGDYTFPYCEQKTLKSNELSMNKGNEIYLQDNSINNSSHPSFILPSSSSTVVASNLKFPQMNINKNCFENMNIKNVNHSFDKENEKLINNGNYYHRESYRNKPFLPDIHKRRIYRSVSPVLTWAKAQSRRSKTCSVDSSCLSYIFHSPVFVPSDSSSFSDDENNSCSSSSNYD
jgi:hypothetical protein